MLVPELKKVAYDPARYIDIETVDEAVHIITTPTEGMTAQQRWEQETPALMAIIERFVARDSFVLDYGCGIGRLSKPLIEKLDCTVVGVDISPNMRALATSLVNSADFCAIDPKMLDNLPVRDFNAAIAVWALQHCVELKDVISLIADTLKVKGKLFIVNNVTRCVPVEGGEWADDGLDVHEMIIDGGFKLIERGKLDDSIAPGWMQEGTFWAAYERT